MNRHYTKTIKVGDRTIPPLLEGIAPVPAWYSHAVCAQTDPESFFPEKGSSTREAKAVCWRCPVREECLGYAVENDLRFGVWGGLSERERRKLKRRRSRAVAS